MGIAAGLTVTLALVFVQQHWTKRFGEDGSSPILLSILLPFLAYLLAEQLNGSGILAAVAAGITMSYVDIRGRGMARTRVERAAIWNTIQFTLNGVIFVLLGEQLPSLAAQAVVAVRESGHFNPWWLAVFSLGITIALGVLRFIWVAASSWLNFWLNQVKLQVKNKQDQVEYTEPGTEEEDIEKPGSRPLSRPSWRMILAVSLTGVRGAVTLAAALAIPFTIGSGQKFPGRNLVIFLAATVILLSLLLSTLVLPYVMRGLKDEGGIVNEGMGEDKARRQAAKAGIASIRKAEEAIKKQGDALTTGMEAGIATRVISVYQRRIHEEESGEISASDLHRVNLLERNLRLAGIAGERAALIKMFKQKAISDEILHRLLHELDIQEAATRRPDQ